MLKLKEVCPHEWEFAYPGEYDKIMDYFHSGCEMMDEGDWEKAEEVFRKVLTEMPDHLDALHHLAMIKGERGDEKGSLSTWGQAVRMGKSVFPKRFNPSLDRLEWGWLDNRPFLRCMHGYGFALQKERKKEKALSVFREILKLNPNDNQGIRDLAVGAHLSLNQPEEALKICESYPGDIMPATLYGRAMALFKLNRKKEADKALRKAIAVSPLAFKELLKKRHRRPPSAYPGSVMVGGEDEAYEYWESSKNFWKNTPGALDWVRRLGKARNKKTCPKF